MDVLSANRGLRYIDQPFGLYSASSNHLAHLPIVDQGQFIHLDREEEPRVERFLSALFSGDLVVNAPWEFWKSRFQRTTDRVLLKIVDAKGLIDWIDERFDVQTVYLTRHPIPTSLSIIRNGWDLTAHSYLRCKAFSNKWLGDGRREEVWGILESGTELEKYVLNWGLENLKPLALCGSRPDWLHLHYEDVLRSPDETLEALASRLDLGDLESMRQVIRQPSRSTAKLSSNYTSAAPLAQITKWQSVVSTQDVRSAQAVLDLLGIQCYTADSAFPATSSSTGS
ncbi:MAG: hypothetical protein AAF624_18065 [Bacteroidota bacterium]